MKSKLIWTIFFLLFLTTLVRGGYLEKYLAQNGDLEWEILSHQILEEGSSLYHLQFTSQHWQEYTWTHRLYLIQPERIQEEKPIFLYISGSGSGEMELNTGRQLAHKLDIPVAILMDVPNQPLFQNLWEDDLLAYTLEQTLLSGDYTWPLLFPMTKAVLKAMDTLTAFSREYYHQEREDFKFILTGGSKRGWTAWLTAPKDPRVVALIPVSYDNLNLPLQMEHQLEIFGDYSSQIHSYTQRGIQEYLQVEEGKKLAASIDPYSYLSDILQPKLIIIGTNDEYWPLSALNLYQQELQGETHLLYLPGTAHDASDWSRVLPTMEAFIYSITHGIALPALKGEKEGASYQVVVENNIPAREIRFWRAISPTRDFREASWNMEERKKGTVWAQFSIKREGDHYQAFFAEGLFDLLGKEFTLSTPVTILPRED